MDDFILKDIYHYGLADFLLVYSCYVTLSSRLLTSMCHWSPEVKRNGAKNKLIYNPLKEP